MMLLHTRPVLVDLENSSTSSMLSPPQFLSLSSAVIGNEVVSPAGFAHAYSETALNMAVMNEMAKRVVLRMTRVRKRLPFFQEGVGIVF